MLGSDLWLLDPPLLPSWLVRQESEFTFSMLLRARSKGLPSMGPFSKGLLHEHFSLRDLKWRDLGSSKYDGSHCQPV